jgi:hypothetical protein
MSITQVQTIGITNDAVTATQIATGAVGTTEIADDAVNTAKIAAGAVGTTEIADDAVNTAKIAAGAVGATEIAASSIDYTKMGLGSVSIIQASNAGTNLITLPLGPGTWFVEFYYTTHVFGLNNTMSMVIEGVVVQTVPAIGDYQGTFYVPMFGANYVSGNRTITCYIDSPIANPNNTVQRCMVKATRVY